MSNRNNNIEDFKYLIDSRNLSNQEMKEEREAILKAREERYRKRSENEKKAAQLLQLKYQMEDYLRDTACDLKRSFPNFLSEYIDTLYDKRKDFASDVEITSMALSHIINNHREPNDSFMYRLIAHSQNTFKEIGEFTIDIWPRVFYKDKVCQFIVSGKSSVKKERKHVRAEVLKIL